MRSSALSMVTIATMLLARTTCADDELTPFPFIITANEGRVYFRMIPGPSGGNLDPQTLRGNGFAYKVTPGPTDRLLWKTSGWYSYSVFLSYDGRYLVRLGNWPRGDRPSKAHLAVAFYDQGKLTRTYSTEELIRDPMKVPVSMSHYEFARTPPMMGEPRWWNFQLETIDGVQYTFDVRDGSVESSQNR